MPSSSSSPSPDTGAAPRPGLPVNTWAILGLLSFGHELTGYQLRQWAENSLGYFHSVPAMSQIYTELRRLADLGYVRQREHAGGDTRTRRGYRITAEGRAALAAWIRDSPVEPATTRNGAMLRVWLGAHADPARLRAIVREHRDQCEVLRAAAAHSHDVAVERYARHRHAELVTRWAERRYAAERELADQILTELADLDP